MHKERSKQKIAIVNYKKKKVKRTDINAGLWHLAANSKTL
jgi:hypothetical protein